MSPTVVIYAGCLANLSMEKFPHSSPALTDSVVARGRLRIALQFSQVVRHRDCVCRDQGHQCSVPQGWAMKILWAQLWWG